MKYVHEYIAEAFVSEGTTTHFALLGDGNMHMATVMQDRHGVETILVRHEHAALGAAMGYHSATGKVGVASVTNGPGFTQMATILTSAVRENVPVVLFAGETPMSARWDMQETDQAGLAHACGATYIASHFVPRIGYDLQKAFLIARTERRPVVVGVPYDLQKQRIPADTGYESLAMPIRARAIPPREDQAQEVADLLLAAGNPIFLAGRGAVDAGCGPQIEALAQTCGALLSTTLRAKGFFDQSPLSLGICGGFAHERAVPLFEEADLLVAFGASLSYHTLDGGKMFPNARIAQVDLSPKTYHHGIRGADIHMTADARLAVEAIAAAYARGGPPKRTDERRRQETLVVRGTRADTTPYPAQDGTVDPRDFVEALETVLPADYEIVCGNGHQAYFHAMMRGYPAEKYHHMRNFGAIGNGFPMAIGVAAARKDGHVVIFDGDGSFIMNIQELETLRRHKLKLLIVCMNDGAYGSEIHKLRAENIPDRNVVFGRTDFASIAQGFGLGGATIRDLETLPDLMRAFEQGEESVVWNVHMSDRVMSPLMRRSVAR